MPLPALIVAFLLVFGGEFVVRRLGQWLRLQKTALQALAAFPLAAGIGLPLWLTSAGEAQLPRLLLVLTAAFAAGVLADTLRLSRWVQALLGLAIAFWATRLGFVIQEIKPPFFTSFIPLGRWAPPATVAWMLIVVFAVILCRRLPGLTGGLVGIISLAFFVVANLVFDSPGPFTGLLALAIAGSALGVFPHELLLYSAAPTQTRGAPGPPTLLAQGAAGHWVLGFALGLLTVVGFLKNTAFLVLVVPLLLLSVPLVEVTYAFVYGGEQRRRSFSLGRRRELLHEALLRGGLSPRRCVAVFLAITLYFSAVTILLAAMVRISFLAKLAVVGVFGLAGFVIFFCAARILSRRRQAGPPQSVEFLEVPVAALDMAGAMARIEAFIKARTPHMIVTSDSSAIVRAHQDEQLAAIMRSADLVTPDGAGVVWMAKVLGLPIEQRVSGIDLIERICARGATLGWRIYLLGAEPEVAQEAARRLCERHPGLQVVGCQHGYFTDAEEPQVVAAIAALAPDVLFVGLGIPRQEKWIARYLQELAVPAAIGVGGSFDVISGRLKRAPKWMQLTGLEWLFRTIQQPKRLPRLLVLPKLFGMTLKEVFVTRRKTRGS